jgi:hypothetical protein
VSATKYKIINDISDELETPGGESLHYELAHGWEEFDPPAVTFLS